MRDRITPVVNGLLRGGRRPRLTAFVAGVAVGALLTGLLVTVVPARSEVEPGELVVLMDRDRSVGEQRKRLIAEWEALYADRLSVRVVEVPGSATAAHSQLVAQAQSGGGGVDVYSLDLTWVAEFADAGWLRPLDRPALAHADTFLAEPFAAGRYDGELWALPFNTDAPLLYYRRDLVGDEPPATWDELTRTVAESWDRAVGAGLPLTAGYAGQFADYEGLTVNVLEAVLAQDSGVLTGDGWATGGDPWVAALERLADGLAPGEERPLILPEALGHREDGSTTAFANGQVLFMRNWPVAYRELVGTADDPGPLERDQIGLAPLPAGREGQPGTGLLGGQSLAVAAGTDQPRAAQRLIEFLTGPRSQQILFDQGGFVPTQQVVYEDQRVRAAHPYLPLVRAAVERARPRPLHPRYEQISEAIRRVVRPYLERAVTGVGERATAETVAELIRELAAARSGHRR